ncbi:hypothetical protein MKK75_06585 [Methylobacterium sp. J-030]|uniref:DUF6894 family protein n=1 Tax=Methylobacterium sp. J-030 TaxID=2836627 RepID=UPI001FBBF1E7|nr:hypothetical protein [Methylobacterium sp. J-030]MCJ2068475.1 hypothetical protein [Methylobacterium sp. J-030]
MPRFFIDTDDGDLSVPDDIGRDLPNAQAARRLALAAFPDMTGDQLPDGDRRTFSVRIRNEEGTPIYAAELVLTGEWLVPPGG